MLAELERELQQGELGFPRRWRAASLFELVEGLVSRKGMPFVGEGRGCEVGRDVIISAIIVAIVHPT